MTGYRMDPAGIARVLRGTGQAAEGFDGDLEALPGYARSAAGACGDSGAIVPALDEFFAEQNNQVRAIGRQVEACLTGAAAATKAYAAGELEMMLTYQHNASEAKISKIPR